MNINSKKAWKGLKITFASYLLALFFWSLGMAIGTGTFVFPLNIFFIIALASTTIFASQYLV